MRHHWISAWSRQQHLAMILSFQIKLRTSEQLFCRWKITSISSKQEISIAAHLYAHVYKHYYAKESCSKRKTYSCCENFAYIHVHQKSLIDDTAEHSLIDWQCSKHATWTEVTHESHVSNYWPAGACRLIALTIAIGCWSFMALAIDCYRADGWKWLLV